MMKNILRGMIALILPALLLLACGGGGSDSGGATSATITGRVAGTVAVALDENGNEIDRNTATGTPKSFTLTVPAGGNYRFHFIENEGTVNERIFELYMGVTNVFTISSAVTVDLGFVDTSTGIAVPANNPLTQGCANGGSKYSQITMSGTWLLLDSVGEDNGYFIADGNGKITDAGLFNIDNPTGNYNVGTDGSLTLTFSGHNGTEVINFAGQFDSPTHANFTAGFTTFEMVKVVDASAAEGTWNGSLTESAAPFAQYNISFQVDANGTVANCTGFKSPVTGKMFALASGDAVGFFRTGETNQFNQIAISGTLIGNSFTGTFGMDNGSPDDDGTVGLTRIINPILTIDVASYANLAGRWEYKRTVLPSTITSWAVEARGIVTKNEKSVFLLQEYSEQGHENDKDYYLTDMSNGLFRVGGANHVPDFEDEEFFYNPEMPYLLSLFVPGQEYTYNFTRTDFVGTITHTVKIEKDPVTVPAGTYTDCYKSTVTDTFGAFINIDTRWYAKNVGLVKRIQSNNGNIWELTSYIP